MYQTHLHNDELGVPVRLVVWQSLARVDAYLGTSFTVFQGVESVVILPGVEAIFKRGERDYMLITRKGQVASSSGDSRASRSEPDHN